MITQSTWMPDGFSITENLWHLCQQYSLPLHCWGGVFFSSKSSFPVRPIFSTNSSSMTEYFITLLMSYFATTCALGSLIHFGESFFSGDSFH